MHTTEKRGWRIHFNSDLSGEAVLQKDGAQMYRSDLAVTFPAELLVEFQARALESAADEWYSDDGPTHGEYATWLRVRAKVLRESNAPNVHEEETHPGADKPSIGQLYADAHSVAFGPKR